MDRKTKKYLVIAGGTVLCIGLIVAIGTRFGKQAVSEEVLSSEEQTMTELVVDPSGSKGPETKKPEIEELETKETKESSGEMQTGESELVIQPETFGPAGMGNSKEAADSRPAQTDQTAQSIQPEPTKPEPPSKEALTDPTQRPDGTKVEEPPIPVDHNAVEPPRETEPAPGEPQAGDTSGSQIYVPGFGWVENHGGGGSGTYADRKSVV